MTALMSLAVTADAAPVVLGPPLAAPATPPGFAALLAAAQPIAETEPEPVATIAASLHATPPGVTAPRVTPAQLWGLIDAETPLPPRKTPAATIADLPNTSDSPPETTETPPETLPLAVAALVVTPAPPPMPLQKAPETPPQTPQIAANSPGVDVTTVQRRNFGRLAAPPISPPVSRFAPHAEAVSPPSHVENAPKLALLAAAVPAVEARLASPTMPPPSVATTAMAAVTPAAVPAPAEAAAIPNPAAAAATPGLAAPPPPTVAATASIPPRIPSRSGLRSDEDRRQAAEPEPLAPLRAAQPPILLSSPVLSPPTASAAAPSPQAGADVTSAPPAAAAQTASARPESLANVATEAFGAVRIGVEGDAGDLKVSLSVTAGTPALLVADAPRLVADLAANGIRLHSLDVGSFAGGAGSGGAQQRQTGSAPAAAASAAALPAPAAPSLPSRPAAADRYA